MMKNECDEVRRTAPAGKLPRAARARKQKEVKGEQSNAGYYKQ